MSLCHLYFKETISNHIPKFLDYFEDAVSLDIDKIDKIDKYNIYIIEVQEADKDISLILKKLFKNNDSLIYFLIPKKYNLIFFQLTYLLNAKDIITQNQDSYKLITKIKKDEDSYLDKKIQNIIATLSAQTQSFIVYLNKQLVFISNNILETFGCDGFENFKKNIVKNIEIKELLENDIVVNNTITNKDGVDESFIIESMSVNKNEQIIYIEADTTFSAPTNEQLNFISSRVSFIELLKQKLIHREIVHNQLSIITVSMKNIKTLRKDLDVADLEDLFIDLLTFMESILEEKLIFAQYDRDFYVILFENISFEEIKILADDFHNKVINYIINQKYKPLVDAFIYNLTDFEFTEILSTIDNIKTKHFSNEQKNANYIQYTDNTQRIINEKSILDDTYNTNTEFKILNIYNGLVINTPSRILKITDDTVYINFEQLQGVVLNIEKKTVLQSSTFLQDIEANVKQIDLKKKIAILEKFKFLKTNANSRKYARVTTSSKIPISIFLNGITINGYILDFSIKSIAIKVIFNSKLDVIKSNNVSLFFNIPNKRVENGYVQLNLGAKVIVITPKDKEDNCKVICDFNEETDNEAKLMEYVYERQKELIIKLKKMSKLN